MICLTFLEDHDMCDKQTEQEQECMSKDWVNAVAGVQDRDDDNLNRRVTVEIGSCVNLGLQKQVLRLGTVDFIMKMPVWKAIRRETESLGEQSEGHASMTPVQ